MKKQPESNSTTHKKSRENQIIAFNRDVLDLSKKEETPLMEKLTYMRIVHSNLKELVERRLQGNRRYYYDITNGVRELQKETEASLVRFTEENPINDQWETLVSLTQPPETIEATPLEFKDVRSDVSYYIDYQLEKDELRVATFEDPDLIPTFLVSDEKHLRCIIRFCDCKLQSKAQEKRVHREVRNAAESLLYVKSYIGFVWIDTKEMWTLLQERMKQCGFMAEEARTEFFLLSPLHYLLVESHKGLQSPGPEYHFPPHHPESVSWDLETFWTDPQYDEKGLLIRTPIQSFDPVLQMIDQCCTSEDIHSIAITLYRVSKNSRVFQSIEKAIRAGKSVYVYIELRARGDEEQNLQLYRQLKQYQSEGYPVMVYGHVDGLKVHAKMFVAIRTRGTIVSAGTGNYNETTARQYVDLHYISRVPETVQVVLNTLRSLQNQICAPLSINAKPDRPKKILIHQIHEETKKGSKGRIRIICNHLYEDSIIRALLLAAERGVKVELTVRTICGVHEKMLTKLQIENLSITRVVGRFLEHARIYRFGDIHNPESTIRYYIGSCDLLFRNLSKRIEVLVPIPESDRETRKTLDEILLYKDYRNLCTEETDIV